MAINFATYYGKISNSGKDQNGKYHGGAAGDQTGQEWEIRTWYNPPWNCVIRLKNQQARELLAELAIEAANNNHIGYDQYQRTTYWTQLKAVGYRPSEITVNCEADCSQGVIDNTKAVGYLLGITALQNLKATYTGNMKQQYQATGQCDILTDSKYLTSYDYLVPGDILLNEKSHTATNLGIGKLSGYAAAGDSITSTDTSGSIQGSAPSKTIKWQGKVSCSQLSVRSWAGTENTQLSFSPLKKNTTVDVCDTVKAKDGTSWYYIKYQGKYGFVSSKYLKKITKTTTVPTTLSKIPQWEGQVTASKLAVRSWAGTEYSQLKSVPTISKGTIVSMCDSRLDNKGNEWYYIRIGASSYIYGFVLSDYIQRVS